jgi:hypothetical protein
MDKKTYGNQGIKPVLRKWKKAIGRSPFSQGLRPQSRLSLLVFLSQILWSWHEPGKVGTNIRTHW